ncbi:MAG TPA: hypothetical protein VLC12_00925 [Terriglobales bacterium]|nr:hypothetical protein [Terriglobales bacterium]
MAGKGSSRKPASRRDGVKIHQFPSAQERAQQQPRPPFPAQHQPRPGLESKVQPRPEYQAPQYKGSEKLKD